VCKQTVVFTMGDACRATAQLNDDTLSQISASYQIALALAPALTAQSVGAKRALADDGCVSPALGHRYIRPTGSCPEDPGAHVTAPA
jgi:hypothetical protein